MTNADPRRPVAPEPSRGGAGPVLRRGLWNYGMDRWAPKNPGGRLAFELAILFVFFALLALLLKLSAG